MDARFACGLRQNAPNPRVCAKWAPASESERSCPLISVASRNARGLPREISRGIFTRCLGARLGISHLGFRSSATWRKSMLLKWKTPQIEEIQIGLEINGYACAEL